MPISPKGRRTPWEVSSDSTRDAYPPIVLGVVREATSSTTGIALSLLSGKEQSIASNGHMSSLGLGRNWQPAKRSFAVLCRQTRRQAHFGEPKRPSQKQVKNGLARAIVVR